MSDRDPPLPAPDRDWPDWAGDPDEDVRASWRDFLARNRILDGADRAFLSQLIGTGIRLDSIFAEYRAYHARSYDRDPEEGPSGWSWSAEMDHIASIAWRNPPPAQSLLRSPGGCRVTEEGP